MATLLKDMKATGSAAEKVKAYNDANRRVAILCNHKRTVTASHANQMEKMSERVSLSSEMFIMIIANLKVLIRSRDSGTKDGD
jgi:ribonucleotide monophosphatase NagD (HAD superfamily)